MVEFATALESGGADELWVIEDCFYTAGPSLTAAALARTERLSVGIGILPAVARTAAMTAMELATLAALGPGRLIAGIGHGVQEWMAQMGVRPASPLTALEEVISAVRRLLAGETLDVQGDYVRCRTSPSISRPTPCHPFSPAFAARARSLSPERWPTGWCSPSSADRPPYAKPSPRPRPRARSRLRCTRRCTSIATGERRALRWRRWCAELVGDPPAGLQAAPFFDELAALVRRDGESGVVGMPDDWWTELAAVGTPDDVAAHIAALATAGATSIALFPPPTVDGAREQRDRVLSMIIR